MTFVAKVPFDISATCQQKRLEPLSIRVLGLSFGCRSTSKTPFRGQKCLISMCSNSSGPSVQSLEHSHSVQSKSTGLPIMVNGSTGKMGRAVLEAAVSAGLHPVPVSFGGPEDSGKTVQVGGKEIKLHGPSERESILSSVYAEYPNLIVVDYTVPSAVNGNKTVYSPGEKKVC